MGTSWEFKRNMLGTKKKRKKIPPPPPPCCPHPKILKNKIKAF